MRRKRNIWDVTRLKDEGFVELTVLELRPGDMVYRFNNAKSEIAFLGTVIDYYALAGTELTYKLIFREMDYGNKYVESGDKLWVLTDDNRK